MTKYRVLVIDYDPDLFDITPESRAVMEAGLARAAAVLEVGQYRTEEAVLAAASDADIVMIQSVRPLLNRRTIPQLPICRAIIRMGLGFDSVDVPSATLAGIPVSNVVGWCNDEVAEHTIALLMSAARKVPVLDHILHTPGWSREEAAPVFRIKGKTLGLIGFGRVAQAVAQRMAGFGMPILAYDPFINVRVMADLSVQKVDLVELLRRSDFICVHALLTEQTRHLLGSKEFDLVKPGAILINTSRGAIVDESALIAALQEGRLRGAAIDVMEHEPLPPDSPLRNMPQVVMTPHLASYSIEAVAELYQKSAEIAADLLSGKWVSTIVNPQVRPLAEKRWGAYKS